MQLGDKKGLIHACFRPLLYSIGAHAVARGDINSRDSKEILACIDAPACYVLIARITASKGFGWEGSNIIYDWMSNFFNNIEDVDEK